MHDSVFYSAGVRTPWFTVHDSVFYSAGVRTPWFTVHDSVFYSAGVRTGNIGKKHVGPESVYPFHFSQTEERTPMVYSA